MEWLWLSFCAAVFCCSEGRARNERRNGRLSLCYNSCSSKSILAQFEMLHKTGVTLHICFGRPITFFGGRFCQPELFKRSFSHLNYKFNHLGLNCHSKLDSIYIAQPKLCHKSLPLKARGIVSSLNSEV